MLRESDQIALYQQAMRDRLTPIVDRVVAEFGAQCYRKISTERTGKDQGRTFLCRVVELLWASKPANLLLEVVNLVDFFGGNRWGTSGRRRRHI